MDVKNKASETEKIHIYSLEKDWEPCSCNKKNCLKQNNNIEHEKPLNSSCGDGDPETGRNLSTQDNCKAALSPQQSTTEEAQQKDSQPSRTQSVPEMNKETTINEQIEKQSSSVTRQKPCPLLPEGFQWDSLDLDDELVLQELYTLLNENYVEDSDSLFRYDYLHQHLKWTLQPPGWLKDWHCGLRTSEDGRLVGFISAVPITLTIYKKTQKMVNISFLCVHKEHRSKGLAPLLIQEIIVRVIRAGIYHAVYSSGEVLPNPIGSCRYWHRPLNPKKLIEVKFMDPSNKNTKQNILERYQLPSCPRTSGFRKLTAEDVPKAHRLLTDYLSRFDMVPSFSVEEFCHLLLPRPGVVDSFIVENDGDITDMVSFFTLPSTVIQHPKHRTLKTAFSFYNVSTKTPWADLMQDALIYAKNAGVDVFNASDVMDNKDFLRDLEFGIGDGSFHYHLFNWACPTVSSDMIGLVLQ